MPPRRRLRPGVACRLRSCRSRARAAERPVDTGAPDPRQARHVLGAWSRLPPPGLSVPARTSRAYRAFEGLNRLRGWLRTGHRPTMEHDENPAFLAEPVRRI